MQQYKLSINTTARGYTIITQEIEKVIDIATIKIGLLHIFLQHSSASLSINENADPTVRADFKAFEEKLVPRNFPYQHNYEGDDDMPAHIKSSLFGCQLTIPISNGKLALGAWQGIYLGEHRDNPRNRKLILTVVE